MNFMLENFATFQPERGRVHSVMSHLHSAALQESDPQTAWETVAYELKYERVQSITVTTVTSPVA